MNICPCCVNVKNNFQSTEPRIFAHLQRGFEDVNLGIFAADVLSIDHVVDWVAAGLSSYKFVHPIMDRETV